MIYIGTTSGEPQVMTESEKPVKEINGYKQIARGSEIGVTMIQLEL